ncbi:MAG: hypothetical protein WCI74_02020 [Actinomycetes bacterium]
MPGFLTNNTNQCCCPEMRCCTPETVVATPSGFSGSLTNRWVMMVGPGLYPIDYVLADLDIGKHACAYELNSDPGCVPFTNTEWNPDESRYQFSGESIYPQCMAAQVVWPKVAFPQSNVRIDVPGPGRGSCDGGYGVYFDGWTSDEACAEKCAAASLLCELPGGSLTYGPAAYSRVQQADLNDSYICHRYEVYLRPEFSATVNRSTPPTNTDIDARLQFDVYCRRRWQFSGPCNTDIIINLSCAVSDYPTESPPEGEFYCIDYRCGPRMPDTSEGGGLCSQYQCTAHEGTAWPHLYAYPADENNTATIKLLLVPDAYYLASEGYSYQGAKAGKPMTWIVKSATATTRGVGYAVGEFFTVNFDSAWMELLNGGEANVALPATEPECGFPVDWADKYGYVAEEDSGGTKFYYQRLRVEEVDENGGIVSLSVVPWYMTPEFRKGACGVEITNRANKTKFYPAYTRILCHPNSVDIGGTGYVVGNTITFRPLGPWTETVVPAVAVVTDVDDDGAVLDWEIKGSDIWRYPFGGGNPACNIYGQPDERGAYKWQGRYLCDLRWHGVGVPVRAAAPYGDGFANIETWVNTGRLTEVEFRISRVSCRTSINVFVLPYVYESIGFLAVAEDAEASLYDRLLKIMPPYPKCVAGGAQITPIIGTDGGNESAIGGPLAGGDVKSGGAYYAFINKTHEEPILPTAVPDIEDGSGAVIEEFTFDSVMNFPSPGYASGQLMEPAAARFAYYPVAGATIVEGGSGYEVGQEFDVQPVGGQPYIKAWGGTGGDNPDACPNGGWYAGMLAKTDESGYVVLTGGEIQNGVARLRVSSVDGTGAITGLEVVHPGMMFRSVWAAGRRHPGLYVYVGSDTGYGAAATVTIEDDKSDPHFGEVTSCSIVAIPIEQGVDPLHSTTESPVPWPIGGRDYANPNSGYMWEMSDIQVGSGIVGNASMLCKVDWHNFPYNAYHPSDSTHKKVEGSYPPFHRRGEACTLDECYHSLLNRTYPLYRAWGGINPTNSGLNTQNIIDQWWEGCADGAPNSYSPIPHTSRVLAGTPTNPYGVFIPKNKMTAVYLPNIIDTEDPTSSICGQKIAAQPGYDGPPSAEPIDYMVIEWDYFITLSASVPEYPHCPDQWAGRTAE